MNFQERYLSVYKFRTNHSVQINASKEKVFPLIEAAELKKSWLIRTLIGLRGMEVPKTITLRSFSDHYFQLLEKIDNQGLVYGLVGQFWKPRGNMIEFQPSDFVSLDMPGFAKATWSINVEDLGEGRTLLTTETRILTMSRRSTWFFGLYWLVVKPFSGIIRSEMLRIIKQEAESY